MLLSRLKRYCVACRKVRAVRGFSISISTVVDSIDSTIIRYCSTARHTSRPGTGGEPNHALKIFTSERELEFFFPEFSESFSRDNKIQSFFRLFILNKIQRK
jgi:hypothetical protein